MSLVERSSHFEFGEYQRISALGFSELRSVRLPCTTGVFGAGCHEFMFRMADLPNSCSPALESSPQGDELME